MEPSTAPSPATPSLLLPFNLEPSPFPVAERWLDGYEYLQMLLLYRQYCAAYGYVVKTRHPSVLYLHPRSTVRHPHVQ